jgi:hypothetical protein
VEGDVSVKVLTTLGGTVVLARSGSARAGATSLLNAQRPTLVDFTLKTLLGGVSLVGCDHLDEAEATGLLCVRIPHDVALLYLAVLLEETRDFFFGERGMDAGDEEVGARIAAVVIVIARSWRRTTACDVSENASMTMSSGGRTGCRDRWARRCGRANCPCRDAHRVVTDCDRVRSREARLRVHCQQMARYHRSE